MNLWHDSFIKIQEGTKTIEMRLYDEKRSAISINEAANSKDMLMYYSEEQINKYGVVGIEITTR